MLTVHRCRRRPPGPSRRLHVWRTARPHIRGDDVSDGVGTRPSGGTPGPTGADDDALSPQVRLVMPALPANVALVRQALAGLTDELGVEPARAADMKIALTEACTNVVVHALRRRRRARSR